MVLMWMLTALVSHNNTYDSIRTNKVHVQKALRWSHVALAPGSHALHPAFQRELKICRPMLGIQAIVADQCSKYPISTALHVHVHAGVNQLLHVQILTLRL